jgi:hypothetical protein
VEIIGFLAVGIGFLLFLSLLFSGGTVEAKPLQVIIQPAPDPSNQGGSGLLVMLVFVLVILFFLIMLQSP